MSSRSATSPTDPVPLIFGPAYLDRVIRVDRPLVEKGRPLDGSVDGRWLEHGEGLALTDPVGHRLSIELPEGWPGPTGLVALSRPLSSTSGGSRQVQAVGWQDDLGGMGAGFASALGGDLVSALGPASDPTSRKIARLLLEAGIRHHPIVVDHPADWTLLVSSGEHGDKLPIGFRGCHAALTGLPGWSERMTPLRLAASLPNRLVVEALSGPATIRAFAPALRNMLDRDPPVSSFAKSIDVLGCNRGEWETLANREEVAGQVAILVVTDGPSGATVHSTAPEGQARRLAVPAFPRDHPPRDTNRAGEAFFATLLQTLIDREWTPGPTSPDLIRVAAERASVASALVLDRLDFGFPTRGEVDDALRAGRIV